MLRNPLRSANRCEQGVHVKHSIIQSAMADFQNRVQRCVQRCQDAAQESLPIKPSEKDIARAQVGCGGGLGVVPAVEGQQPHL